MKKVLRAIIKALLLLSVISTCGMIFNVYVLYAITVFIYSMIGIVVFLLLLLIASLQ